MWKFNFWKNYFFLKFLTQFWTLGKKWKMHTIGFNFKGLPCSWKQAFRKIWVCPNLTISWYRYWGAKKMSKIPLLDPFMGSNTSKSDIFSKILAFLNSARQELSNGMWKFNVLKKNIFLKFLTVFGPLGKNEKCKNRFSFNCVSWSYKQALRKIQVCPNLTISW